MLKTISYIIMALTFFIALFLVGNSTPDNQNLPMKETNSTEYSQEEIQQATEDIRNSHIETNSPSEDNFAEFLKRDLELFFKKRYNKEISVEFELLRDGPTQSGVAYPKHYAWIIIYSDNEKIEQGAVRLAAIDTKYFDITHFISRDQIKKDVDQIYSIFPSPVCDKIKKRL